MTERRCRCRAAPNRRAGRQHRTAQAMAAPGAGTQCRVTRDTAVRRVLRCVPRRNGGPATRHPPNRYRPPTSRSAARSPSTSAAASRNPAGRDRTASARASHRPPEPRDRSATDGRGRVRAPQAPQPAAARRAQVRPSQVPAVAAASHWATGQRQATTLPRQRTRERTNKASSAIHYIRFRRTGKTTLSQTGTFAAAANLPAASA